MSPRLKELSQMGVASARSEIKRINERIAAIGRKFGTDSEAYQDAITPLMIGKYADYIGVSKSGYIKINANVKKDWNDENLLNIVKTARQSAKTITQLKSAAAERLKSENPEGYKPTEEEILDEVNKAIKYKNDMAEVLEYMYSENTDAENRELYPELYRGENGTKPTRKEIDDIIEREREKREEWFRKIGAERIYV